MNTESETTTAKTVIPDNKNQVTGHFLGLESSKFNKHWISDLLSVV